MAVLARHRQKEKGGREKPRWTDETESQWQPQLLTFSLHLLARFNFLLILTLMNL